MLVSSVTSFLENSHRTDNKTKAHEIFTNAIEVCRAAIHCNCQLFYGEMDAKQNWSLGNVRGSVQHHRIHREFCEWRPINYFISVKCAIKMMCEEEKIENYVEFIFFAGF